MRTAPRIGSGLVGWRRLTVVAALADAVVLFGYGIARGDRESLGFAVVMLVGLGLLRVGRGLLGLLVMAALRVNDPVWGYLGKNASQEEYESMKKEMGMDRSFVVQYLSFLGRLVRFDFSEESWNYPGQTVGERLRKAIPPSLSLTAPALGGTIGSHGGAGGVQLAHESAHHVHVVR